MPQTIDYEFAQQELMMQEMSDDPVQTAIEEIEKSHERDKEGMLQESGLMRQQIYTHYKTSTVSGNILRVAHCLLDDAIAADRGASEAAREVRARDGAAAQPPHVAVDAADAVRRAVHTRRSAHAHGRQCR